MEKARQNRLLELLRHAHELIKAGEELPANWMRDFFPPDRKEYELTYLGKESEEQILADTMSVPLQEVSTFGHNGIDWHNKLIFGDNLQAMKTLLQMKERGELTNADGTPGVRLIYIDPPFSTKRDFRGTQDQKAYQDKIAGAEFLEFLRRRLVFLQELLADDGVIYVHVDWKKGHYVKVLMDEIFGEQNFLGDITWYYYNKMASGTRKFPSAHDLILSYSKNRNSDYAFNPLEEKRDNPVKQLKRKYFEGKAINVKNKFGEVQYQIRETRRVDDVWRIACLQPADKTQNTGYPTQKPEALLARIIRASSNDGDLVLDAFAGAGTTCAVAEKLNRRWIAIDCGKFAIYTIQKRMLNLHAEIGNTGKALQPKAFTLYNAGLYDFETLRQLNWDGWKRIALQLFECKDEQHEIHGFKMDGKRKGASVFVFNHFENKGGITRETIGDIHAAIGQQVGGRCFIIAPRGFFHFQEDYIQLDDVRYYALRIPYSIIHEIHSRDFSAILQPTDEMSVNDTVDAIGFDFIQAPAVEYKTGSNGKNAYIQLKKFESHAQLKGVHHRAGMEAFSMLMIDYDFDGKVFDLDEVFYADKMKQQTWKATFDVSKLKGDALAVFLDIYGNEARIRITKSEFGVRAARPKKVTASRKKK